MSTTDPSKWREVGPKPGSFPPAGRARRLKRLRGRSLVLLTIIPVTGVLATSARANASSPGSGLTATATHVGPLNPEARVQPVAMAALRQPEERAVAGGLTHTAHSTNWSGLAGTGAGVEGARGQWTVPAVTSSATPRYSSSWVGVDGVLNRDLIQTGTEQDSNGAYSAWWEILPNYSSTILGRNGQAAPVRPGDEITASVNEVEPGIWAIFLDDSTQRWYFEDDFNYSGPGTSAEWIEEAPTVNGEQTSPADFATAHFSDTSVYLPGRSGLGWYSTGMNAGNEIAMVNSTGATILAMPSAPSAPSSSGQSFSDTYVTAPGTPTGLKATPAVRSVQLSWQPPVASGGTPVAGYYVRQYRSGVLQKTVYVTGTSTTVAGLVAGGSYSFSAACHTSGNYTSGYSAPTARVVPRT